MLFTWIITITFNTELGIACGIGGSILAYLYDVVSLLNAKPSLDHSGDLDVRVVKIGSDMTFLTANEIRDYITSFTFTNDATEESMSLMGTSEKIYHRVSNSFESVFAVKSINYVSELPRAIALDLSSVKVIDLTGLHSFEEILHEGRSKGIKFVLFNVLDSLKPRFVKFGIYSDNSTIELNLDSFLRSSAVPAKLAGRDEVGISEEALGSPESSQFDHEDRSIQLNKLG